MNHGCGAGGRQWPMHSLLVAGLARVLGRHTAVRASRTALVLTLFATACASQIRPQSALTQADTSKQLLLARRLLLPALVAVGAPAGGSWDTSADFSLLLRFSIVLG